MQKRSLTEIYFQVLQQYEMFTQGVPSSRAIALLNYNEYKALGGKRYHAQLEELKQQLNIKAGV